MLLDLNTFIEQNELPEVTTNKIKSGTKMDPNGMFSQEIFGVPSSRRYRSTFAFVNLYCKVLQPSLYEVADRFCGALLKFFDGRLSLQESKIIEGSTGSWGVPFFAENIEAVTSAFLGSKYLTESGKKLFSYILKNKELAFIDKWLILPPAFRQAREEYNNIVLDDVSQSYVRLITEAQIIKNTEPSSSNYATGVNRVQTVLFNTYKFLEVKIKGKAGIQRSSLLGKTLDFSARGVIVGDPDLPPSHIGLPVPIVLTIFKPFIINLSMSKYYKDWNALGIKASVLTINALIDRKKKITKEIKDLLVKIAQEAVEGKVVIAKRDPSLHRLSLRAFYVRIVDGYAIHINPLVTDGFNADFDGDTMAVYLPVTKRAQDEARTKMLAAQDIYAPTGGYSLVMKNDVVYGVYLLTAEPSAGKPRSANTVEDLIKILLSTADPTTSTVYKGTQSSVGRLLLFSITGTLVKDQVRKKTLSVLLDDVLAKHGPEKFADICSRIVQLAVKIPTLAGKVMAAQEFELPDDLRKRKDAAFASGDPQAELGEITKEFLERKKQEGSIVYDLVDSGGRGGASQIMQTSVAKGYVAGVGGTVIEKPVTSSLNDGLSPSEYFIASFGGRKGLVDRSQNTANSGYLTRQYVYALASVKKGPKACNTNKFLTVDVANEKIAKGLLSRYMSNGQLITNPKEILGKQIQIYSPMYCTSPDMCERCLGDYVTKYIHTKNVGIVAAQSLGERGTQETMRTFHCLHKDMLLYVREDGCSRITTFEALWDELNTEVQVEEQEVGIVEFKLTPNIQIWDKEEWTTTNRLMRHKKQENEDIVLTRTATGDFVVSQSNHPHVVRKNAKVCPEHGVPYISSRKTGSNLECPICGKRPKHRAKNAPTGDYLIVEPNNINPKMFFAETSFPIWKNGEASPMIDAYLLGFHVAEGSFEFRYLPRFEQELPNNWCLSQNENGIKDKVEQLMSQYGKVCRHESTLVINDTELSRVLWKQTGRYSWEKHLPFNFNEYSDAVLAKILCGIVDGDGCVFISNGTVNRVEASIEVTSILLIQQIHHIAKKLGIHHLVHVHPKNEYTKHQSYNINMYINDDHHSSIFKDSIKVQGTTPCKSFSRNRNEDMINYVKPILFDENEYVYDLETESHTLTVNGFWTHNSGGAASMKSFTEDNPALNKALKQDGSDMICLEDIRVSFDEEDISSMTLDEVLLSKFIIYVGEESFSIDLDYTFTLFIPNRDDLKKEATSYSIEYEHGMIMGSMKNASSDVSSVIVEVQKMLVSRKLIMEDLLMGIVNTYLETVQIPFWPAEIVVSQVHRDMKHPAIPWRLGGMKEDPLRISLKQIPLFENWKRASAFENVSQAIMSNVLFDLDSTRPADIDRLLSM